MFSYKYILAIKYSMPMLYSTNGKRWDKKKDTARMLESHLECGMEWSWKADGGRRFGGEWESGFGVRCREGHGDGQMALRMSGKTDGVERRGISRKIWRPGAG